MSAALDLGDAWEPAEADLQPGAADFSAPAVSHQSAGPSIRKPGQGPAQEREVDRLYPYDPMAPIAMARGTDILRCMPDREMAQLALELQRALESSWSSGEAAKWREWEARDKEAADLKHLTALGDTALKGGFGPEAKELAHTILMAPGYKPQKRTDLPSLREFEHEFLKIRRAR